MYPVSYIHHLGLYMRLVGIVWKCILYGGLYMTATAVCSDDSRAGKFCTDMQRVPEAVGFQAEYRCSQSCPRMLFRVPSRVSTFLMHYPTLEFS